MNVRAKFRVHNKTVNSWGTEVQMSPVYGDTPENRSFFASTPSGDIRMTVKNEVAAEQFEVNKEYYIDFKRADV